MDSNIDSNIDSTESDLDELADPKYNSLVTTSNNTFYNTIETLLITNSSLEDPKSYKEVLLHQNKDFYLEAMQLEIDNLIKNNT